MYGLTDYQMVQEITRIIAEETPAPQPLGLAKVWMALQSWCSSQQAVLEELCTLEEENSLALEPECA